MSLTRCVMLLIAASASVSAAAAPTYLKCEINQDGGPLSVNFVLDESVARVGIIVPQTGAVDQVAGTFLADRVLATNGVASYEINRIDLTISRAMRWLKGVSKGTCKVEPLPKRAF